VVIRPNPTAANTVDDALWQARTAYECGVRHVWFGQRYDLDALMMSAVIAAAVPELHVGTAIVPINPRHPLLVASAAQTAQAAAHGKFSLGIGLGGNDLERKAFGLPPMKGIARLQEYLTVLHAILTDGTVDFDGEQVTAHTQLSPVVAGGIPFPIYVAAMGPKALQVAGQMADGTIPYLAGPNTIAELIKPTIEKAAADAGRSAPRIIASVPVAVTTDRDAAQRAAQDSLNFYDQFPSSQQVLAREGLSHATDLAFIGTVSEVAAQLQRYRDAGVTDLILSPFQTDPSVLRGVWELAAGLTHGSFVASISAWLQSLYNRSVSVSDTLITVVTSQHRPTIRRLHRGCEVPMERTEYAAPTTEEATNLFGGRQGAPTTGTQPPRFLKRVYIDMSIILLILSFLKGAPISGPANHWR
jgi:F420-dependent oxidoreductase-like protein